MEAQEVVPARHSLFRLIDAELAIIKQIEDCGGEITPETDIALTHVQLDRMDKVDACKYMIDQFAARSASIKAREEELRGLRKQFESVGERIKARIKEAMTVLGTSEAIGNDYRFKLSERKDKKVVINQDLLPTEYLQAVTQYVPDRDRIEQDLLIGLEIPGATLEKIIVLNAYVNSEAKTKPTKKVK